MKMHRMFWCSILCSCLSFLGKSYAADVSPFIVRPSVGVDLDGKTFQLSPYHKPLLRHIETIQSHLRDESLLIQFVREGLAESYKRGISQKEVFYHLSDGDLTIGQHIASASEQEALKSWWFQKEGASSLGGFCLSHERICRIIMKHGRHVAEQTFLIADLGAFSAKGFFDRSLSYFSLLMHEGLPSFTKSEARIPVFVSGRGNTLLRILEWSSALHTYSFICFDEVQESRLHSNLIRLLSHRFEAPFQGLNPASSAYHQDVVATYTALETVQIEKGSYDRDLETLSDQLKSLTASSPDVSRETIGLVAKIAHLPIALKEMQKSEAEAKQRLCSYLTSTQRLRLYLWGSEFLPAAVQSLSSATPLVVLSMASSHPLTSFDLHCLFLEGAMAYVDTESERPVSSSGRREPFGFFEKLTNHKGLSDLRKVPFRVTTSWTGQSSTMLPEERNPLEITFRAEPHPVIVFANDDKIKEQSSPSCRGKN